ncbi:MAG: MFS transporter [Terrimicrobiaceae bacterium]|nr:MFS transporter [Terrimicrobiaceae bacterium]
MRSRLVGFSRNIPLFIAFRVLFNARFYYPVLGILFLDLGLTLEQYALLNVAWAVAIVTLEIPSGALADVIGRKRMVVLAAGLMVLEMLLFAFAPAGRPGLLFALLLLNRVLSGAAEACASGADEALAFDSLPSENRNAAWPRVLERLMRWQSGAFFVAMILGSLLYDPAFVRSAARLLGSRWNPSAQDTVRWPVDLTLLSSLVCLAVTLALREPPAHRATAGAPTLRLALQAIRDGARAVVTDRRILLALLAALSCDSIVRLFMTFESNYLRLIALPEFSFGVIGSTIGLLGFVAAPIARRMVATRSASANFSAVVALILVGLIGAVFAIPLFGVWVVIPLGLAMNGLGFFLSHYLNLWARPGVRATILSFRGVTLNLAYGTAGLLFAGLTGRLRAADPSRNANVIFADALHWLPVAFGTLIAAVGLFAIASRRKCRHDARPAPAFRPPG